VDDIYGLDGPKFFRLAYRIPAYKGVIRARFEYKMQGQESKAPVRAGSQQARYPAETQVVDAQTLAAHFPDIVERVTV
jgi:hypothetical protein